ncbi:MULTISPECIES: hypothetical protein [unclassified Iodidimonas]|jgi:hypothetical protein|uniref:hypothetical protein n=1 Tax=unclassified Iodidimonas TaxID=2626145 RepID=UPI0024824980|nr:MULTISPECIES: hypothetical protein [unclassified Iodidimonas]
MREAFKVLFCSALLSIYAFTSNAQQEDHQPNGLAGIWGGEMRLSGNALDINIEFEVNDAGAYKAHIISEGDGQSTPISNVVFNPPSVTFQLNTSGLPLKFDGELTGKTLQGPLSVEMLDKVIGELVLRKKPEAQ